MNVIERQPFVLPPPPEQWQPSGLVEGWLDGYIQHLSASGLRLLKVCPEAWRHRYVLGEKERPGESLVLGSAIHDALAYTHRLKIKSHEDRPVQEVVEFFNDCSWPNQVEEDGGVKEIRWDNDPDTARSDGARVTSAYHLAVSPRIQPIRVEQKFEYVVPGVPVPLIGYIDFEEESDNIDLKSGKQVSRKPDANWRTQGSIYSAWNGKPTHFHSASRAKTPSICTPLESEAMSVMIGVTQKPMIEQLIRHYAELVEWFFNRYGPDEPWPTTGVLMDYKGGRACDFCGYRPTCPAWAHERVA